MTALETLSLARRNGISPSLLHPLLAILSDPPMKPTDIAAICGVGAAAITPLIEGLVQRGMIQRSGNRNDRRVSLLIPTEKAFELFAPIIPEIEA